jgi:hypothetical protein
MALFVEEDIPLYTSVEQITERLHFHPQLDITDENLRSIVAKYELPPDRTLWAECGWNNCGTAHRFGFVISDKHGRETMCGQDCANTKGGVQFKEVIARHKAKEEKLARQKVVAELLKDRADKIEAAMATSKAVNEALYDLSVFETHFRPIWRQLQDAARVGGSVWAAIKRTDWSLSSSGKEDIEVVARIAGHKAISGDGRGLAAALHLAVRWYEDVLHEGVLTAMDDKELKLVVPTADRHAEKVRRGAEYVEQVAALIDPRNVRGFEPIVDRVLRTSAMATARDAVQTWPKVHAKLKATAQSTAIA